MHTTEQLCVCCLVVMCTPASYVDKQSTTGHWGWRIEGIRMPSETPGGELAEACPCATVVRDLEDGLSQEPPMLTKGMLRGMGPDAVFPLSLPVTCHCLQGLKVLKIQSLLSPAIVLRASTY